MFSATQIGGRLRRFRISDSGAATVDFVVGTALALGLTLAVMNSLSKSVENVTIGVEDNLTNGIPDYTATFGLNTGR